MSDNNKIIVNMSSDIANKHLTVLRVFGRDISCQICPISEDIKAYWHIPKFYRTIFNEIKSDFIGDISSPYSTYVDIFNTFEFISFEFDNEEEALYFKLKFCS